MNAAVVTSFDEPPHYQRFPVPEPGSPDELLVDVLAVGLHQRVRTGASGSHYTSSGTLPMIPGIDGVGRRPDGRLVYFAAADDVLGTMAEKALVAPRRSIELPDEGARAGGSARCIRWELVLLCQPEEPERDLQLGRAVLDRMGRSSWAVRMRLVIVFSWTPSLCAARSGLMFSSR